MTRSIPTIAIVGRTNVGKSSLFNAIAGRRIAVVEDEPGVTRDRHYAHISRHGFPMTLVDTGGLVGEDDDELRRAVREQTHLAISEADLLLVVFDGVSGPHGLDSEVVDIIRRSGKDAIWVVNKCERPLIAATAAEFYALGIDEIQCVSAAHRLGIPELIEACRVRLAIGESAEFGEVVRHEGAIRVAIIGKPNVGKSTMVNKLCGAERVITSPIAGTTRDNIDIEIERDGQRFVIVDTAGLRRRHKVKDLTAERYSNLRTLRALAYCDVAVVVIDATQGAPTEQEAKIAGLAHERGRGLVIVVNKWDAVEKTHTSVKDYKDAIYETFKFARYAPIVFTSALSGRRCPNVLDKALEVAKNMDLRVQTSEVNKILGGAFKGKPPPVYHGAPIKLFFATQIAVRPPTFVLFVNAPRGIPFGYERYLKNVLREHFPFEGVDVKFQFRKRTEKAHQKEAERSGEDGDPHAAVNE